MTGYVIRMPLVFAGIRFRPPDGSTAGVVGQQGLSRRSHKWVLTLDLPHDGTLPHMMLEAKAVTTTRSTERVPQGSKGMLPR